MQWSVVWVVWAGLSSSWSAVPALELSLKDVVSGRDGVAIETPNKIETKVLETFAREYVQWTQGRLSQKREEAWVKGCGQETNKNPFCALFLEESTSVQLTKKVASSDLKAMRKLSMHVPSLDAAKSIEAFKKVDHEALRQISSSDLYKALKTFQEWDPVEKVAASIVTEPKCLPAGVYTSVGLKVEEFLPEERFRRLAVNLYERAISCTPATKVSVVTVADSDAVQKAHYRAGLLHLWKNDCIKADPHMAALSVDGEDDSYRTRALYWRAFCANKNGNRAGYESFRFQLQKYNPLGFHTLAIDQIRPLERKPASLEPPAQFAAVPKFGAEPKVLLRSLENPGINNMVRSVEWLQRIGARDVARDWLRELESKSSNLEPEFRLYLSALYRRNQDSVSQFRLIASAIRDRPSLIASKVMRLFYPLDRFQYLWDWRRTMDPFLVAALIRQESGFNQGAQSHVGALGLMQIMPETARLVGGRISRHQLLHPKTNVRIGVRYLASLVARYHGDVELALGAYNAGPERVDDWVRRYPVENKMLFLDLIPFMETRNYVALIGRNYYWYLELYRDLHQENRAWRFEDRLKNVKFSAF